MALTNDEKSYLFHRSKNAVNSIRTKKEFVNEMVQLGYKKATVAKSYKYAMIRKQEVLQWKVNQ